MDEPPSAAHPCGARCARPKRTASRLVNSLREFDLHRADKQKKPPRWGGLFCLVEVARIELASASPTLRDLHAYSVFNLTVGYPTGRENLQPVQ